MVGMTPIASVPASGSARRRAASTRSSASTRTRRARSTSCSPAGVGSTRRRSRSNSRTPRALSSWASCALREGWDTPQAWAARRKLRASASATAYCSCRSEVGWGASDMIVRNYYTDKYDVLELSEAEPHGYSSKGATDMLTIGGTFPAFKQKAVVSLEKGKEFELVSSDDHPGKWKVVFFWPKDFTFVCPTEIAAFGKRNRDFEDREARVLGVSTDNEYVHLAWRKSHPDLQGLPFPMLSDLKHELVNALGILHKGEGVA